LSFKEDQENQKKHLANLDEKQWKAAGG